MLLFEWDVAKNRRNRKKHGVSFETAIEVFMDPFAITDVDQVVDTEERLRTVGRILNLVVVVVSHLSKTEGEDEILRIISARKATAAERTAYEETHD